MKTKLLTTALISFILSFFLSGQVNRAAHWYFGYEAGIDFSSGSAVKDLTGKLISIEGSASISDIAGNLLFYSNGEKVWSNNGSLMPNGSNLIGHESTAQSAIIIPKPGSNTLYYLFTPRGFSNDGLYYHLIDMTLNAGLGDVTATKNMLLHSATTEELAATRHCNAEDYWLLSRKAAAGNLVFYAYQVNSNGISSPVISSFPATNPASNVVGGMTFSQDGNRLAFSSAQSLIFLYNFNRQTGQLSLNQTISPYGTELVYSNALSGDASKLYITSWMINSYCRLSQFDLTATNITASRKNLDSVTYIGGTPNGYGWIGQVRLGPDQKIYVSRWHQRHPMQVHPGTGYSLDSLGVINAPNQAAPACNYQRNGFYLDHKPTMLGLPNFVSNFTSTVTLTNNCPPSVGISKASISSEIFVYPNPFSEQTTVRLLNPGLHTIKLTDILGRTIETVISKSGDDLILKRGNLSAGIYYLQFWNGNEVIAERKIIVL